MAMTALDRKVELIRRGQTVSGIARELGVSVNHVSQVVLGNRRSPRVEAAVARALGRSVSAVFGRPASRTAA